MKFIIIIAVIVVGILIYRQIRAALNEARNGPRTVLPSRPRKLRPLRRTPVMWHVAERKKGNSVIVSVEHPIDGIRRSWEVEANGPDAHLDLMRARADAAALAGELEAT